jgi:inner membrane protein YidH
MSEPHSKPPRHVTVPEEKRATEYLANERTFLAWIRTSIAVISAGFVISRFAVWFHGGTPNAPTKTGRIGVSFVMGIAMMALGALVAILAVSRYHTVNRAIDEGRVKADRGLVILVTVLVVLLATGMIAFMLLTD